MRLTISDKRAFVRAVMRDVPEIDYNQQAHDIVLPQIVATLPPEIQKIWKNNKLKGYIKTECHIRMPGSLFDIYQAPASDWVMSSELCTTLNKISELNRTQSDAHTELATKLRATINNVTTLKKALELFPEFAQYLPAPRDPHCTPGVPVVTNVVADLIKAGWPKEKS